MCSRSDPDPGPWPRWIAESYRSALGEDLGDPSALYTADFVVLCHDTAADPLFVYANLAAQRLWEREWSEFIGWPSRLTAPPDDRAERFRALSASVVVRGYSGLRVSRSGRLFRISGATVWHVHDDDGTRVGQAATFGDWAYQA